MWASWLAIGHLTSVPFLAVYLMLVGANSWVHSYSFWNDPPPTDRAEMTAVASLWALVVVAGFIGSFGWGWMCLQAGGGATLWESGRRVIRPFLRRCWYATPLLIVTAACVLLIVPGVVAVALVGVVPFVSLAPVPPPDGYTGLISRCAVPLFAVGCVALPISILFWMMVVVTSRLASVSPPLAWLVGWACFCAGTLLVGGAASAFASVYGECQEPISR